jgi:hypothetical protein
MICFFCKHELICGIDKIKAYFIPTFAIFRPCTAGFSPVLLCNFLTCENSMIKYIFLSMLVAANLFDANAQALVSGGLKMEANVHQFWLYDLDDYTSRMKIAPNLGGFLNVELNDKLAIQPEMMFFFRNSGLKYGDRDDRVQQWGMILPAYLVGREHIDGSTWYFGLGAYVGFGFNAQMKNAKTALYGKTDGRAALMNRWDYGISALIGCEYDSGIQINAGLQLGLKDQLNASKDRATAINKTITAGIGYHF